MDKNCDHKGHFVVAGNSHLVSEDGKSLLIITTLCCTNCGTCQTMSSSAEMPASGQAKKSGIVDPHAN